MENNETATKPAGGYKRVQPRWKPGESGNPAGATPRFPDMEKLMRQLLCKKTEGGFTRLEVIVSNLVNRGLAGDIAACEAIVNIVYGKEKNISVPVSSLIAPKIQIEEHA